MTRVRYQIRFTKVEMLRWISHRDLARLWERILRRARLKPSMTEGFHPKPRIGFPSALALGIESYDEVVEIDLAEQLTPDEVLRRLSCDRQPGLTILKVCLVPPGFGKAQLYLSHYEVPIPDPDTGSIAAVQTAIERLRGQETITVERKTKKLTAHVATQIPYLGVRDDRLQLTLAASRQAALKPVDVISAMGLDSLLDCGASIVRTRVELEKEINTVHCALADHHFEKRQINEKRNVNQCFPAGRESHCDSGKRPSG